MTEPRSSEERQLGSQLPGPPQLPRFRRLGERQARGPGEPMAQPEAALGSGSVHRREKGSSGGPRPGLRRAQVGSGTCSAFSSWVRH